MFSSALERLFSLNDVSLCCLLVSKHVNLQMLLLCFGVKRLLSKNSFRLLCDFETVKCQSTCHLHIALSDRRIDAITHETKYTASINLVVTNKRYMQQLPYTDPSLVGSLSLLELMPHNLKCWKPTTAQKLLRWQSIQQQSCTAGTFSRPSPSSYSILLHESRRRLVSELIFGVLVALQSIKRNIVAKPLWSCNWFAVIFKLPVCKGQELTTPISWELLPVM